jgi:hypothetical protein
MLTVALATPAPVASTTLPAIVPFEVCALAEVPASSAAPTAAIARKTAAKLKSLVTLLAKAGLQKNMEDCLIILGLLKQVVYRQNISADSKVDHPGREM